MKTIKTIFIIFGIFCLMTGCKLQQENDINNNTVTNTLTKTNITHKKIALICNLTKVDPKYYDGWEGDCPGTDVDAKNFVSMCTSMNIPYVKIENEQCTNQEIVNKFLQCVSCLDPNDGLFIFFYSGHGGQIYSSTEDDGLDETLCFWDGQMPDDAVWQLLNKVPKTCRIFMVTDCCNSGSNYRLPYALKKTSKKTRSVEPNMFHIGGCNDGEYSYGSKMGGVLTTYLKRTMDKNLSYSQWYEKTKSSMKSTQQVPTFAETGKSFNTNKIFQ